MDNHIIYNHTFPNNKIYVGQTYGDNEVEWNRRFQKGNGYRSNRSMYQAIREYGWDNVKTDILFTGLSKQEADHIETLMIALYDATNTNIGYNISRGGAGNNQGKNSHSKDYRKEERVEYHKQYRKEKGVQSTLWNYEWRKRNPERYKEYHQQYYLKRKQQAHASPSDDTGGG